jgi:hypothetical protein
VLDYFETGIAGRDDAPVTLTVRINGRGLPVERALQAQMLRARLAARLGTDGLRHRAAEKLGLDRRGGQAQLGVSAGGLFFSEPTAGVSFLGAVLAAGALGKAWDDSSAGQDGVLARAARAAVSVSVPVAVIIDDADCLDMTHSGRVWPDQFIAVRPVMARTAAMAVGSWLSTASSPHLRVVRVPASAG